MLLFLLPTLSNLIIRLGSEVKLDLYLLAIKKSDGGDFLLVQVIVRAWLQDAATASRKL